jgi:hypothetical protein
MLLQSEWEATYKPTENPNNNWGGGYSAFETYSPEVDIVWAKPNNLIWTEIDGDEGTYIVAGKHLVNRIQYYICDVAWEDENLMAVISIDKECDECNGVGEEPEKNEDGSYDDCWVCGGRGFFTRYPETREELIELVGEERANG